MAENTKIEWCDSTFNPWTGCTKVGPGCDHCYAEGWAKRSGLVQWGPGAERRRTSAANWKKPLQWNAERFVECTKCGWRGEQRKAHSGGTQCPACSFGQETLKPARRRVFCASLADVFDNEVPAEWRADLFWLIHSTPNLDWLLVTKRIGNAAGMMRAAMLEIDPSGEWPAPWPNVWLGITVVNQAEADRDIPKLLKIPAAVRFLSMEPLLGPVDIEPYITSCNGCGNQGSQGGYLIGYDQHAQSLCGKACSRSAIGGEGPSIDWVVVGGESGPGARPMHLQWARDIRDQCEAAGVPFLFKQWGEWETGFQRSDGTPVFRQFDTHEQWVAKASSWVNGGICLDRNGKQLQRGADMAEARDAGNFPVTIMHKVGKKKAGRLLDGREHNGFPIQPARGED